MQASEGGRDDQRNRLREWVCHIGVYESFSDELKMALAKEALKPWNLLPIIPEVIRSLPEAGADIKNPRTCFRMVQVRNYGFGTAVPTKR